MNKEYVDYLKRVSEKLDKTYAMVLHNKLKTVGLCYVIMLTQVSDNEVEYKHLLHNEIDKVRQRKNVFYGYQTGKTDDDMQFLWHPSNYKVRKRFLAGLINKELDK
jgi:hypothetical protein